MSAKKSVKTLTAKLDLDVISDKEESISSSRDIDNESSEFAVKNEHKDLEDFFSEDSVSEHDLSSKDNTTPVSNIIKGSSVVKSLTGPAGFED